MLAEFQKALVVNQRVQVTVWDPNNDRVEFHYPSYIMDVEPPFVMLALPTKQLEEISACLQPGVVAGVILESYPTPYVFYPIMHRLQETPAAGYWFKMPENPQVETIQRRRHVRIPMVVPVEVEYMLLGKWITLKGYTEDLSGGGLRFTSTRLFEKGQELLINLSLEDAPRMQLKSTVVFSSENRVRRRPEDIYATACQFDDLDDQQEMLIMRECFRRELKKPL